MKSLKYLLALLFVILFGLSSFAQNIESDKAKLFQELIAFKDLKLFEKQNSKKQERAGEILILLTKQKEELEVESKFLWSNIDYIWQTRNSNLVVMESPTFTVMPGQKTFTFYFFDKDGNLINKEIFSTGWKMFVENVEFIKNNRFDFPIIKFTTASIGYVVKEIEYVALLDESITLIRLESGEKGSKLKLSRHLYNYKFNSTGSKMPTKMSVDKWIGFLNSQRKVEILQALFWLSGKHQTVEEVKSFPNFNPEAFAEIIQDVKNYETVINRQDVQERLKELAKSSNQWIKEAAILALTPIEKRKGN